LTATRLLVAVLILPDPIFFSHLTLLDAPGGMHER